MKNKNLNLFALSFALLIAGGVGYVWLADSDSQSSLANSPEEAAFVSKLWETPKKPIEAPPQTEVSKDQMESGSPDENCPFRPDVCDNLQAHQEAISHWLDTGGWTEERQEKFFVLKPTTDEKPCVREKIDGTDDYICWNNVGYVPQYLYSDEVLKELSDTDPVATVILADRTMRAGDKKLGAAMYLRAAKMTGKPGPLVRFASKNGAFSRPGELMVYEYENYVQPIELQVTTYVYGLVADSMGYPLPLGPDIRNSLVNADVSAELIRHAETSLHDQLLSYVTGD